MAEQRGLADHDPLTEEVFRQLYNYRSPRKETLRKRIFRKRKIEASKFFPILKWLPEYNLKTDVVGDLVAGLTVAVMHIPHGLAYAPLAGQQPVVGLYMAVFSSIIYFFLGTSRHISLGTFAVLCMMVGKVVQEHGDYETEQSNNTLSNSTVQYSNLDVGITVCFTVGVWQFVMGVLHLGALWVLLSNSLVRGFTTGAATHVMIYQFKNLLGVNTQSFSGPLKLIYIVVDLIQKVPTSNIVTVGLSACSMFILFTFNEYFKPIIQRKFPRCRVPVPMELIVIILGIIASYTLNLQQEYGVKIVGNVPTGMPEPVVPSFSLLPSILIDCFVIAIVGISMCLSLATIFAKKDGYELDSNQELIAYGLGNIFASFFQSVPTSASLSRSLVQHSVGGKSLFATIFTIIIIILILLFLGPLFEPVPYSVLSSIVFVTLKGLAWQVKDLPGIWRLSKLDGAVWLVTFLSVVFIDLDYGLGIGLCMSVLTLVLRGQFPKVIELGKLPDTNLYLDINAFRDVKPIENVLILKIAGNVHFANSSNVLDKIMKQYKTFCATNSLDVDKKEKAVILEISCVPSIDPTAATGFSTLFVDLKKDGAKLILSNVNESVYDFLLNCKFFDTFPKDNVYFGISDAVDSMSADGSLRYVDNHKL